MPKSQEGLWICAYDLHYPKMHKPTWNALLDFISKNKIAGFIFGGDQFDNEEISHHTDGQWLYRQVRSYKSNQEGFERDILSPLAEVLTKTAKRIWIIGNHDRFCYDFIERNPQLQGVIEREEALQIAQRGWEIVPLGHAYRLGKLNVIHGEVLTGFGNQGPAYPSRKAVELYAGNVLAGHTHSPQQYTKISPVVVSNKWQGTIAPILGATNPTYLRNRPTAWLCGFVIVEVRTDGNFNLYSVIVNNGTFSFGGIIYGG